MEKIENKYYVYRHIRLDTNEVFYVGIGTKYKEKYKTYISEYKRAFDKSKRRSIFWKRITSKTGYRVEIVLESHNYEFIKEKEKEFIKLYGRRDLGEGTLVNMTDGGEGTVGRIASPEAKQKTTEAHIIPIYHKETNEIFSSIKEACLKYNLDHRKLSSDLKKQIPHCKFQYVNNDLIKPYKNLLNIKILQKSTGRIFETMSEACKELKTCKKTLKKQLSDSDSDFVCLNRNYLQEKILDKRNTYVLDTETGIIYKSIIEAWKSSNLSSTYDVFRAAVTKKLNFRYAPCDKNGISYKRTTRLPKSEKQKECAANVWRNKEIPDYVKKARKEAIALKVVQKSTGLIFDSIREGADFAKLTRSTFRKRLNNCLEEFDFEYLNKNLNIKKEKTIKEKKLALGLRKLKNIPTKTSKYVGVSWDKSREKWLVQCRIENGKKVYLGRYDDEESAAKVYQDYLEILKNNILDNYTKNKEE